MVVRGRSHFCQPPKNVKGGGGGLEGGQEFFNQNVREGQHCLLENIPKFPNPPPQEKKRTFPYFWSCT